MYGDIKQINNRKEDNYMRNTNSIVICRDNYSTREEWEAAIGRMVMELLNNRQIMTVRYDEPGLGIVDIEFNSDRQEWGDDYPYWLSPTEAESIVYDDEREDE